MYSKPTSDQLEQQQQYLTMVSQVPHQPTTGTQMTQAYSSTASSPSAPPGVSDKYIEDNYYITKIFEERQYLVALAQLVLANPPLHIPVSSFNNILQNNSIVSASYVNDKISLDNEEGNEEETDDGNLYTKPFASSLLEIRDLISNDRDNLFYDTESCIATQKALKNDFNYLKKLLTSINTYPEQSSSTTDINSR